MQYSMQVFRESLQLCCLVSAYLISFTLKNGDHLKINFLLDWDLQVEFHLFILLLVINHYRDIVFKHNYHIMLQWLLLICNNSINIIRSGLYIYNIRFPEKHLPGKFDNCG